MMSKALNICIKEQIVTVLYRVLNFMGCSFYAPVDVNTSKSFLALQCEALYKELQKERKDTEESLRKVLQLAREDLKDYFHNLDKEEAKKLKLKNRKLLADIKKNLSQIKKLKAIVAKEKSCTVVYFLESVKSQLELSIDKSRQHIESNEEDIKQYLSASEEGQKTESLTELKEAMLVSLKSRLALSDKHRQDLSSCILMLDKLAKD